GGFGGVSVVGLCSPRTNDPCGTAPRRGDGRQNIDACGFVRWVGGGGGRRRGAFRARRDTPGLVPLVIERPEEDGQFACEGGDGFLFALAARQQGASPPVEAI